MFTIRITETVIKEVSAGQQWEIVGKDEKGESIYGYTPKITKEREVSDEIYSQTVDDLDIKTVIAAVNNEERQRKKST